jgi:hypothetical protein
VGLLVLVFLFTRLVCDVIATYGGAEPVEELDHETPDGLLTVDETSADAFVGNTSDENSSLTRKRLLDGSSIEDNLM